MKRKIVYTLITLALILSAFLIGKNMPDIQSDNYLETVKAITDWNTDGNELVLNIGDNEYYAYKSENIYDDDKGYLPFDQVIDWSEDNENLYITLSDGNVYMLEK
jgi:hypothetical protein